MTLGGVRLLQLVALIVAFVQAPPRDHRARPTTGSAVVRGIVVDGATGLPLAGARVLLRQPHVSSPFAAMVTAGNDGTFEFAGLAAGDYALSAGPGEMRATHLFRVHGIDGHPPAVPKPSITINAGEARENIRIALPRARVIEGQVLNEFGEPMANVEVNTLGSSRRPGTAAAARTDDRGRFRLHSLEPGRYQVCADPRSGYERSAPTSPSEAAWRYDRACAPDEVTLERGGTPFVTITGRRSAVGAWSGSVATALHGDVGPADVVSVPAAVRGQVVDELTGNPVPRAVVELRSVRGKERLRAVADQDGRFELAGLVPEAYVVIARGPEFSSTHLPGRADSMTSLQLRPGETRRVSVALERARAISGRVLDEHGAAVTGAGLLVENLSTGSTDYPPQRSDDLGEFRVFGLEPGSYRICAVSFAAITVDGMAVARQQRFVTSCYPEAGSSPAAGMIVQGASDVTGVEIQMRWRHTVAMNGLVRDASGAPAGPVTFGVLSLEDSHFFGSRRVLKNGEFSTRDLVPGRYVLTADTGGGRPDGSMERQVGRVVLDLSTDDVEGIVVSMRKGARLRGLLTFEDGLAPATDRISVTSRNVDPGWPASNHGSIQVLPDLTFAIAGLFGPQVVEISGLPSGMVVRSIRHRGREILHVPTEFASGFADETIEVLITNRVATLSGRVRDERGNPTSNSRIHLFPADPQQWRGWPPRAVSSAPTGAFHLTSIAAGDYFVAAIPSDDHQRFSTRDGTLALLRRLAKDAERVTLLENERRTVDLRVVAVGEDLKR